MKTLTKIMFAFLSALISLSLSMIFIYPQSGYGSSFGDNFFGLLIYLFPILFIAICIVALVSGRTDFIRKFYLKKSVLGIVALLAIVWGVISWNFQLTNDILDIFYWFIVASIALIVYFKLEKLIASKHC